MSANLAIWLANSRVPFHFHQKLHTPLTFPPPKARPPPSQRALQPFKCKLKRQPINYSKLSPVKFRIDQEKSVKKDTGKKAKVFGILIYVQRGIDLSPLLLGYG